MAHRDTTHPTCRVPLIALGIAMLAWPAAAVDEGLRAWKRVGPVNDPEPKIDLGLDLPPSSYPLQPVDQIPFRGARHGFVNTTTGNLVFRMADLRLAGRMPIEIGRVYDSAISSYLPPPPPNQQFEPRWINDLGKNWILGYSAYLVVIPGGVMMATPEGTS